MESRGEVSTDPAQSELDHIEKITAIFSSLDSKGQGFFTAQDLSQHIHGASLVQLDRVVQTLDSSGEGRVNFEDFRKNFEAFAESLRDDSEYDDEESEDSNSGGNRPSETSETIETKRVRRESVSENEFQPRERRLSSDTNALVPRIDSQHSRELPLSPEQSPRRDDFLPSPRIDRFSLEADNNANDEIGGNARKDTISSDTDSKDEDKDDHGMGFSPKILRADDTDEAHEIIGELMQRNQILESRMKQLEIEQDCKKDLVHKLEQNASLVGEKDVEITKLRKLAEKLEARLSAANQTAAEATEKNMELSKNLRYNESSRMNIEKALRDTEQELQTVLTRSKEETGKIRLAQEIIPAEKGDSRAEAATTETPNTNEPESQLPSKDTVGPPEAKACKENVDRREEEEEGEEEEEEENETGVETKNAGATSQGAISPSKTKSEARNDGSAQPEEIVATTEDNGSRATSTHDSREVQDREALSPSSTEVNMIAAAAVHTGHRGEGVEGGNGDESTMEKDRKEGGGRPVEGARVNGLGLSLEEELNQAAMAVQANDDDDDDDDDDDARVDAQASQLYQVQQISRVDIEAKETRADDSQKYNDVRAAISSDSSTASATEDESEDMEAAGDGGAGNVVATTIQITSSDDDEDEDDAAHLQQVVAVHPIETTTVTSLAQSNTITAASVYAEVEGLNDDDNDDEGEEDDEISSRAANNQGLHLKSPSARIVAWGTPDANQTYVVHKQLHRHAVDDDEGAHGLDGKHVGEAKYGPRNQDIAPNESTVHVELKDTAIEHIGIVQPTTRDIHHHHHHRQQQQQQQQHDARDTYQSSKRKAFWASYDPTLKVLPAAHLSYYSPHVHKPGKTLVQETRAAFGCSFKNTHRIGIRMNGNGAFFHVYIDGQLSKGFATSRTPADYELYSGISLTKHMLRLERSDQAANQLRMPVFGVIMEDGGQIVKDDDQEDGDDDDSKGNKDESREAQKVKEEKTIVMDSQGPLGVNHKSLVITKLSRNGMAYKSGAQIGWRFLSINDTAVTDSKSLRTLLTKARKAGPTFQMTFEVASGNENGRRDQNRRHDRNSWQTESVMRVSTIGDPKAALPGGPSESTTSALQPPSSGAADKNVQATVVVGGGTPIPFSSPPDRVKEEDEDAQTNSFFGRTWKVLNSFLTPRASSSPAPLPVQQEENLTNQGGVEKPTIVPVPPSEPRPSGPKMRSPPRKDSPTLQKKKKKQFTPKRKTKKQVTPKRRLEKRNSKLLRMQQKPASGRESSSSSRHAVVGRSSNRFRRPLTKSPKSEVKRNHQSRDNNNDDSDDLGPAYPSQATARSFRRKVLAASRRRGEKKSSRSSTKRKSKINKVRKVQPLHEDESQIEQFLSYARHGRIKEIRKILKSGTVDVDSEDATGNSAFILACQNGHKKVAEALVEAGANINHRNQHANSGLFYAMKFSYNDVAKYARKRGGTR